MRNVGINEMNNSKILLIVILCALSSCNRNELAWHSGDVTNNAVSFSGSYENAIKFLSVKSHEWKIITVKPKEKLCEWGFRIVIECKDDPEYHNPEYKSSVTIMPVSELVYSLYDEDDFFLTSMSVTNRYIELGKIETIQESQKDQYELLHRARIGRVKIVAGYRKLETDGTIMMKK